MKYEKGNLYIEHDFEIKTIREEDNDMDILIPIENRTLNLYLEDGVPYLKPRLQFSMVRGIMIRFCTLKNHDHCTIHILRNMDIHAAIMNFEMDYKNHYIDLKKQEYCVEMRLLKRI
ncbi:hypothetical protein [Marinisporobacter balticus]|uniref:Uncharacterized protein n=1 Tax=Marinisporobacter balticus TaxID=2018667 RepID=A0A4R2KI49_9FIRM|nr:hypothetical protein [Marinisporobacter balticus]TCO70196.1 hypothetical protein EV214_12733 [Marinisporobacter balticus]